MPITPPASNPTNNPETISSKRPWYTRPFLMMGLFVLTVIIVIAAAFMMEVWNVKQQIEEGTFDVSKLSKDYGSSITAREGASGTNIGTPAEVSEDDDPTLGASDAKVVIIAFEDFECPFSHQAFPEIREVMTKFPDRVRFVYRDFPNTTIHAQALDAALAAECAQDQGKFWEMHDKLFLNYPRYSKSELKNYAKEIGLSTVVFNQCFDQQIHLAEIQKDIQEGIAAGAAGTPTWFVNGIKIQGAIPSETWGSIIEYFL